jgi:RHS repeat-associated protein
VPIAKAMRFTGKERDAETGLDYFGARYMSAAQGRFTSPDAPFVDQNPADPQSWNLYGYVRNSPLVGIDPDGREACFERQCPSVFNRLPWDNKPSVAPKRPEDARPAPESPRETVDRLMPELTPGYEPKPPELRPGTPLITNPHLRNILEIATLFVPGPKGPARLGPVHGPRPKLVPNSKHHPNSTSPSPSNVGELFERSIEDATGTGTRWVKDSDGVIHRFSPPSNGETHWNGSTAGPRPIKENNIPKEIKRMFK